MASTLKVQNIAHTGGTVAATIDSNGFMFPKLPHFLIRNTTAQTVTTSAYTRAEYNDTVLDTHSFADLSNNRINFNSTTAGVYSIGFRINPKCICSSIMSSFGYVLSNLDLCLQSLSAIVTFRR